MKSVVFAGVATALLSGAASAADLPRRAAPPVFEPIPYFSWTGFYAGLHSAYGFTDNERVRTRGNTPATRANVANGFRAAAIGTDVDGIANLGGGFGANFQLTPGTGYVFGAAFDLTWTDLHKDRGFVGAPNPAFGGLRNGSVYHQELDYLGTVNGKIGYAFDRLLVYGTAGLAFGQLNNGASFFNTAGALQFIGGYDNRFATGYDFGAGVEYAIPEDSVLNTIAIGKLLGLKADVTFKAEYIRYDLGSRNVVIGAVPGVGVGSYTSKFSTEGSIIRAGFNYKFTDSIF